MTDYECLMQLLGEDSTISTKNYLRGLLEKEMDEVFEDQWVFPIDTFRDIWQNAIEDMAHELVDEYKEEIKKLLRKQLLEAIEGGDAT